MSTHQLTSKNISRIETTSLHSLQMLLMMIKMTNKKMTKMNKNMMMTLVKNKKRPNLQRNKNSKKRKSKKLPQTKKLTQKKMINDPLFLLSLFFRENLSFLNIMTKDIRCKMKLTLKNINQIKIQIIAKLTCLTNNKFCHALSAINIMNKCLCFPVCTIRVLTAQLSIMSKIVPKVHQYFYFNVKFYVCSRCKE